jgi:hypothetical protein
LSELRVERPRQWGACWLALTLWQQRVLKTLMAYRLIDPGSEWKLHRPWFDKSATAGS